MNDIILLAVQLGIAVVAFAAGKYIFPKAPKNVADKLDMLSQWAAQFVVWAKEFMKEQTGEEKMAVVVEKLKEIADEAGLGVTQDQLKAIAQSAYNAMKAGEKGVGTDTDNAAYYKMGQRQKGSTVNIYTGYSGTTAVATNNVPDGALEDNPDGSVNVYNEAGEKVGTISAEEAEAAEQNVGKIVIAEDGGEWLPQRTG